MPRVIYNRKLNEKPRIFRFFTMWEFALLVFVLVVPVVFANMLGLPPTFSDSFILFLLYLGFLLRFKIGRPEGYFPHWVIRFFTPLHLRPGHLMASVPIVLPSEPVPTKKDLANTQIDIYNQTGLLYVSPGKAVHYSYLPEDMVESLIASLEAGEPQSLNFYVSN